MKLQGIFVQQEISDDEARDAVNLADWLTDIEEAGKFGVDYNYAYISKGGRVKFTWKERDSFPSDEYRGQHVRPYANEKDFLRDLKNLKDSWLGE